MGLKSGYKRTEVGIVPEEWVVRPIHAVSKLINGRGFKPFEWTSDGLPIIRIQNLNGSEEFNFYRGAYDQKLEVDAGQLLFAWSGSRGTSFGPHIWRGPRGLLNYHTWKVQVEESEIDRKFYFYALRKLTSFIEGEAHGAAALVHVQKWQMEDFEFPLPPTKVEQQSIAQALSDADALIESLEQLLAKKRHLKQGTMQELLTGKRRLPGFTKRWVPKGFGEVAQPRKQRVDPRRSGIYEFCVELEHIEQETGRLVGFAATGDESSLKSVFQKGDVLFGKLRAYLRKHWLADRGGVCSTEIWALTANHLVLIPSFLFQTIQMGGFIDAASEAYGTHMPRSDWNVVKNYEVMVPPIDEQAAIATVLSDMDAEVALLEAKLAKARKLKQGMMQELLTGRIRLV